MICGHSVGWEYFKHENIIQYHRKGIRLNWLYNPVDVLGYWFIICAHNSGRFIGFVIINQYEIYSISSTLIF